MVPFGPDVMSQPSVSRRINVTPRPRSYSRRSGSVTDFALDLAGITLGLWLFNNVVRR